MELPLPGLSRIVSILPEEPWKEIVPHLVLANLLA